MGARPVHVKAFGVFLLAFCAAAPLAWGTWYRARFLRLYSEQILPRLRERWG